MTSVLAVALAWKVALGVIGVAALVWFLLAAFVASRWPDLHPWLGKLRTPPARMALVGVLVALALGTAFVSRSAYARSRSHDEFGRRRSERRLVLHGGPERGRVHIHAFADGEPALTMVNVGGPCTHGHITVNAGEADVDDADAESQEAMREAEEEARQAAQEAYAEAEERAREAAEEARERAQEARERAQERIQEAQERARERAQEARERAREAQERAQEIAEREMERAQEVMERMGDEMESTRDAVHEGLDSDSDSHSRSKMESFLERQAEKVERLGREMADQIRGLASRFGEDDEDDVSGEDSVDL